MVNRIYEKRNNRVTVAAILSALLLALAALTTGLVFGVRNRTAEAESNSVARYLLIDAASSLDHSLSALRLCNEEEPARELGKTALVYAVRAETALECDHGIWDGNRQKEAFLNDVATVLHTEDPLDAVKKSDVMFKYSTMFLKHVKDGAEFEYNGEIAGEAPPDQNGETEASEEDIEKAKAVLKRAINTDSEEYIGSFGGRIEFVTERGGKSGYAITEGEKVVEFSFAHSGGDGEDIDSKRAGELALETAEKCGFDGLKVFNVQTKKNFAVVSLCRDFGGAMACDDCASVAVVGDEAVAFTGGHCVNDHKTPKAKVDERSARRAAPKAEGSGTLVTRIMNGKERVCYRYRYELEDGVHFVYVCAESGKQIQVN